MNIDERIEGLLVVQAGINEYGELRKEGDPWVEDIRHLLRDVLEYVKPEWSEEASDGSVNWGKNEAVLEIETKQKELGL